MIVAKDFALLPGERILWSGKPLRHKLFRGSDIFFVPWLLLGCGWAVAQWIKAPARSPLKYFFLVAAVLSLFVAFGRLIVRAIESRAVTYAITDLRELAIASRPWKSVIARNLQGLPPPVLRVADGETMGTIDFGPSLGEWYLEKGPWRGQTAPQQLAFRDIGDVRAVNAILTGAIISMTGR